jgi:hypothetical protein
MPDPDLSDASLLALSVRVPQHVVHRSFAAETVVLNLETGRYHGLNPSAGRMLEVLERAGSVGDAAGTLAEEYGQPRDRIERDLAQFCRDLLERRLIEIADDGG